MEFRTPVNIEQNHEKITYQDRSVFIGSCFASAIGEKMKIRKLPVLINPFGTVYNPLSVGNTIEAIMEEKVFSKEDLYLHDGIWLSFSHYTEFSSDDADILLTRINENTKLGTDFLRKASFLFITFGTARVYRFSETGRVVSNCHKVPASFFRQELLSADDVSEYWSGLLDRLRLFNPELKTVFTISPVRHWKDGAHGNQVSKSVLFLALENILKQRASAVYFPAYEIVMDELRDYRFYDDDMLHLSGTAEEYIWEKFSGAYFDKATKELQSEVMKVVKACSHRFNTDSLRLRKEFAVRFLGRISEIETQYPELGLAQEKEYFEKLLHKQHKR